MPDTIAHLGTPGTFTHQAAVGAFGVDALFIGCPTILGVFEAVEQGRSRYGVVPVENSSEGGVTFTLDGLVDTHLRIIGELLLPIEQCLISHAVLLTDIRRVCSHPQGLAQCRRWLHANLPEATLESMGSTTAGVEAAQMDPHAAGIGNALASDVLGVPILKRGIQDSAQNETRFIVLGTESTSPTGADKTSIAFSTRDERGALRRALQVFDDAGINLCRIESRPRRGKLWEYLFFTDMEGHEEDANVGLALQNLRGTGADVRVFGSYPRFQR